MIKLVEDYDLWNLKYKDTLYLHAALLKDGREPKDIPMSEWNALLEKSTVLEETIKQGKIYYEQYMEILEKLAKGIEFFALEGIEGVRVNAPLKYRSDLGILLYEKYDYNFAMIYEETEKGIISCSLRSKPSVDVRVIAEKFGGGGHKNAAAFSLKNKAAFEDFLLEQSQQRKNKNKMK